jgi:hypothetical protein
VTPKEHERLYELIQSPPPGSKIEAAKRHGVDLTLNVCRLQLTPTQRAEKMQEALEFLHELKSAAQLRNQ